MQADSGLPPRLPAVLERLHSLAHRRHPRDLEGARVAYLRLLVEDGHATWEQLREAAACHGGKVPCAWSPADPIADAAAELEAARRDFHDSRT